jgi:hypothetical protein
MLDKQGGQAAKIIVAGRPNVGPFGLDAGGEGEDRHRVAAMR